MKGIITVLGKDHVGIIGNICIYLAQSDVNILDISQTIVGGYLNMMMIVDLSTTQKSFTVLTDELEEVGKKSGVVIKIQHEDIFHSMHRI